MLKNLHLKKQTQLIFGLLMGIIFGFLLQKGGAGKYDIILGQLLLKDFTVIKIMLSAVVIGMIGIYILKGLGLAQLHPKPGSIGMTVVGGLIFGVGFAVLGYCPGTISAAIGQGNLDALFGGLIGILIGSGIFAHLYPGLQGVLKKGWFGDITIPEYFKVNPWMVILPLCLVIILFFYWIESMGL
ncbi:MAG: YeeE/YedE family protein [Actinobacteria bacterium RBG_13_35_12]|uniref:YeeE/YedE family protein n=1 Tax=Candidatus Sediminicultor quintus TaxID=1797291 RepID=A0A1F5A539_9BACT|nr:MAG: YeeE/YedE family protein [Actinobacteria bacterium RBG_13_35_12]OGD13671.1 MAG: YeeE/YedE family protein [Candidatus Atribacteria bacterium RBG_19FT_COMBO_35_14]OGD34968.1 MAG: YeeE/YedE family protein [Candidatus Atribacteria bacterium RBG_16_35_8]